MVVTNSKKTANGPAHDNIFRLPPKTPRIIPIIAPNDANGVEKHLGDTSESPKVLDPLSRSKIPITPPTIVAAIPQQHRDDTRTGQTNPEQAEIAASRLNIYSQKYVPLWLRAINDSLASTFKLGKPLQTLDFETYVGSFAGSDFIPKLRHIPPPELSEITISDEPLSITTYASYWTQRLQNEFAQQQLQSQTFALYDTTLSVYDAAEQLFILRVPGLRENTPRLDLGDVVQVRPLHLHMPQDLARLAARWWSDGKQQGYLAPGYTGILHRAVVWAINKQKEDVILQMDNFHPGYRCNVVFTVQLPKIIPVYRASQDIATSLEPNSWPESMLFPDPKDGVLQTTLSQATFDLIWFDEILNWEQKKAIHTVLSGRYGSIPYLISGPPGTGKTKTLVELALQYLAHQEKRHHLLICAPSDAAADTIALRLSAHLQPHELFRLNSWMRTYAEVPDGLLQYTYSDHNLFSLPPFATMMSFRAVVTTCRDADILVQARLTNIALSALVDGLSRAMIIEMPPTALHWTALLLDEAAQATEPDVLIPLSVIMPPNKTEAPQFIAAGDQYQLGPKLLTTNGLEMSLFQRLFEREVYADHPLARSKGSIPLTSKLLPILRPAFTNLVRNYRSHPAILSIPSTLFYNDTLIPERKTTKEILSWPKWRSPRKWPVLFHQNEGEDFFESVLTGDGTGSGALHNPKEATIALELALSLLKHINGQENPPRTLNEKDIMVMSPYKAQVSRLRKLFREHKLYDVNIGPLEAFQGLESRVVIICTTRTRLGLTDPAQHVTIDKARSLGVIDEPQRLNVAMTRAKEGLVVIGNAHCLTCTKDRQWLRFLDFCQRNGCYDAPEYFRWPDLGGPYPPGRLERALMYAALGEAAARGKTLVGNDDQDSTYQHDKPTFSSFKLKGPHLDMDDEMWQFRELAQQGNNEHVDLIEQETLRNAGYDLEVSDGMEKKRNNLQINRDGEDSFYDGYDRNVHREFFEGCASQ